MRDENKAPSIEVLPQVVVHPPKREKKRCPVRQVLCKALMEPEYPSRKTDWGPY